METKHTPGQLAAALCIVGEQAILTHQAWVTRNSARLTAIKLLKTYTDETGEWFDPKVCAEEEGGPEIMAAKDAQREAQKALNSARRKLRAAIAKATGGAA